jgi:pimeloyl-ACP methyl ester carboxylesterase/predicted glycosyltransferase
VRAREPAQTGFAVRDGVRISYEIHGNGGRTLLFFPAWSIAHSRMWKAQVPYFARHARVVTFDGRGNGKSDRAPGLDYSDEAFYADALAVMDATETKHAVVVALSAGVRWALMVASRHPERVERLICIGPAVPLAVPNSGRASAIAHFDEPRASYEGWQTLNRHYWKEHYREFLEFFFGECLPEPHSTKQFEDAVEWGLGTTPETLAATVRARILTHEQTREMAERVRCPILVIHGEDDRIIPPSQGRALSEAAHAALIVLEGSGHLPQARKPVRVNLLIRDAIEPREKSSPKRKRQKRALFISSPIGLGHAQRDVAIAGELRKLDPNLKIEWLAQHPVTEVLRAHGETIHPASSALTNESAHFESESAEHDLHAFQAMRRMDEILVSNFMVFYDLVREEWYDLVVGDEAWDVDYFLHEHPAEKHTAFAWMTDFVGFLPMPDGGEHEARIATDYNAEMIEHIERFPRLRDRSIFVGNPDDVVPESFGPGLPSIREWTRQHYDFSGYVTGFVPPSNGEHEALREELGYHPDEIVCIATVGGSGVGSALLRRIIGAFPLVKKNMPQLRMIVVAGPRIDPASLPAHEGLETRGYIDRLYRHLSVCDIALVQGGLTTTMELTAARRPFIYFPLRHHFEQNFHVRYRLERYAAGRCMDYATAGAEEISQAIVEELARKPVYRTVESDGAARAAALVADIL